ncbi:hypothetical protein E1262_06255 [Jiangella aurantiaca]|uniref:Alpha-galactosidase n=1 Tax=Jiangella aurantiaca TaxID=2530373 RepID=A0A4R5AFQ4_9ACTN|nr:alpha-galactosidase [Jiangella aurantiaca]TDD71221.1 hypothetical protein E1262_06255 [Jiangella aurantiaca]
MTSAEIMAPWAPGAARDARLVPVAVATARVEIAQGLDEHTRPAVVESDDGGVLTVTVRRSAPGPARVLVRLAAPDAVVLWRPSSDQERVQLPPAWEAARDVGPFSGTALGSLVGRHDRTLLTYGAVAGDHPVRVRAGMVEETAEFMLDVDADLADGAPLTLHLDLTGAAFVDAVADIGRRLGLTRRAVALENEQPVLCTWYSFHQDLDAAALDRELELAGRLGFGTLIVDDGWQTADAERGYGSCGDWRVEPAKVPDARALVERARALGLRTMWWIGTPFLGYRSQAYREAALATLYDEPAMEAAVLDPRSPRARRHLVGRVTDLVRSSGADGLKLDFLERFAAVPPAPGPADGDRPDSSAGALALLAELVDAVHAVRPEAMIEFREPYVSPASIRAATMVRVADCPLSPAQNRRGIVSMRAATSGVAVHSDPIMWSQVDSPERIAHQLLSALFGVPQVSVRLAGQSAEALEVLSHWLTFWRRHAPVLLHGSLSVRGVADGFTTVEAAGGETVVTVRYADVVVPVPAGDWSEWHLANGGEDAVVVAAGPETACDVELYDCRGRLAARESGTGLTLRALPIPAGGRGLIRRF